MTTKAKKALSAGANVEATLRAATGPQIQVTGTSGMLSPSTEVCASRLIPWGWKRAVEKNGLCPCASAVAGHWKNHRKRAGSPQPHSVWVEAPRVHASPHNSTPSPTYDKPARPTHSRVDSLRSAGTPQPVAEEGPPPPTGCQGSTGASRPVPPVEPVPPMLVSWYSSSTLTAQMSCAAPYMFSTVNMAVYIE